MEKILAILISSLLTAGASHAAEIYNKNANKLDIYGKVDARHLWSHDKKNNGDATFIRFGFKGETQINNQITGYGSGNTIYREIKQKVEQPILQPVLGLRGSVRSSMAHSIMAATMVLFMIWRLLQICYLPSVAILIRRRIIL